MPYLFYLIKRARDGSVGQKKLESVKYTRARRTTSEVLGFDAPTT